MTLARLWQPKSTTRSVAAIGAIVLASIVAPARAGGPMSLVNQQPVVYPNGGASITLNLDQGPLGSRSNAAANALVQNALGLWNGVTTSTMRLHVGAPLAADYTLSNYAGVLSNYSDGINPVIFDSDGAITDALFGAGAKDYTLGFAGSAYYTSGPQAGRFSEGRAVLNGFIGISDSTLTIVVAHEVGHFFGLDHTQLDNVQGLAQNNYALMYPVAYRTLMSLHEDDAAAVTSLYPAPSASGIYGQLTGTFTTAGGAPILGANIWARENTSGKVYSVVSDYLMQGSGYFKLLLPPGAYSLHAESIHPDFTGGSGVGPYAESPNDPSFQAPHPVPATTLGNATPTSITIVAGCAATTTFRLDGTGAVGGNCTASATAGNGLVVANPYGALSVQGATLVGNAISNVQSNAVIQLGNVAGNAASFAEIDFQGMSVGAGNTLTVRSGAPGQNVVLYNTSGASITIGGALQTQGGNGAPAPTLHVHNPGGITVNAGGSITALSGLTVDTLGATWTTGQTLANNGEIDGGASLRLQGARITGAGAYKGNAVRVSTFGNTNHPINGAHYLDNGILVSPSSGGSVMLALNGYGSSPQVFNVKVRGNASLLMPSAWPAGTAIPANNLPVLSGMTRAAGVSDPAFGGGSMIVQATGTLTLATSAVNDLVFPGGIVLKAGGTLDLNGVLLNNGWTASGKSFQGIFFESPTITSSGNIRVLSNNLNWINFSTLPHAPVRASLLVPSGGSLQFVTADGIAPHRNTYSTLIDVAANGGCWVCLVSTAPVNMF